MKNNIFKKKFLSLLFVSIFCFGISEIANAQVTVSIPDAALKTAIETALGVTNPTSIEMLNLTTLIASSMSIVDLTGLEYAGNLTVLSLYGNQIIDISTVAGLTNLTQLDLGWNQIIDNSAVSGLTNLTVLSLDANQIIDISAVSGLTNLNQLYLSSNQIIDISAVSGLTNLTLLVLDNNQIIDISAVSGLTNLTFLLLTGNPLNSGAYCIDVPLINSNNPGINFTYDPDPYPSGHCAAGPVSIPDAALKTAIEAALGVTNPTSIDMLNLIVLVEFSMSIVDLTGLEYAGNLEYLSLGDNQIIDISAVSGLTNLTKLDMPYNQIIDISAVSGLTNLTDLNMPDNQIIDISAVSGLTNLAGLDLSDNQIIDISAVAGLTNLLSLSMSGNQIIDISAVSGLTNLWFLYLTGNPLNSGAYCIDVPLITSNNPGIINFTYDPDPYPSGHCAAGPVSIPDAALKTAIEVVLGVTNPTSIDMQSLTTLTAPLMGIVDLTGLEYAGNLTSLNLYSNQIIDISALAGLTNLSSLWLNTNQIIDISAVSGLTNLTQLRLSDNQIIDISAVSGLTNLYDLWLDTNQIIDISAVSGLTNLWDLYLDTNQIIDISAVSGLTNLWDLYLGTNQIINISAVSGLTNLKSLGMSYNQIIDISAVSGLTNLMWLDLGTNQIIDISAVSGLTNLTGWLGLDYNQIIDISAVSGLTNLRALQLSGNQISDISVVSGLTNLTSLQLIFNQIIDISAVSGLTNLTGLSLTGNQIIDISAVSGLTNLTGLQLSANQIIDISAVSGLTNLTYLYLSGNQISDISVVSGLTNLTRLYLSLNQIIDISAVSGLTNLTLLGLDSNQIIDISSVSGLTNLTNLYLDNNQIIDISAVSGLTNLTYLRLTGNPLNSGAYCIDVPLINSNNPGINFVYDPDPYPSGHCAAGPISIPDAALKTAIEAALGVTNPTSIDMLNLTTLGAASGIVDLTGLEYAGNLTHLNMPNNQIIDISAVSGLTNLTYLSLWRNQIIDISAVSGLTNLTYLSLWDNQIIDISAVSGLTNLTSLDLNSNQIIDISAVSGLTNLTYLDLSTNQIIDISAVSGLANLTGLYLSGNQIIDISAVSGLTNLWFLGLDGNQIIDISAVSGLTNLTDLFLENNQIIDISAVSGLTNLKYLFLKNNQIIDISAVSGLTNLTDLYLDGNPLNSGAYCIDVPLITSNNPGIYFTYDTDPYPSGHCGGANPNISASPNSHDFGNLHLGSSSAPQTFTVANTGNLDLIIGAISLTGADTGEFSISIVNDNCSGQTIASSGSCAVDVVYNPTTLGLKNANLSIPSNDPDTPTLDVPVSGTGVDNTPPTTPGTPVDGGLYSTSTAITFTWTAASDTESLIADYNLQVGTAPGGSDVFAGNVGNVLTSTVTGTDGDTLYARVQAVNGVGTQGNWSGDSDGITVDITAPNVTITTTAKGPTGYLPIPVTMTFNEDVTGLSPSDITVTVNGNSTLVSAFDMISSRIWTASIRPLTNGTVTVVINAGVTQDLAGNNNIAAAQFSINYIQGFAYTTLGLDLSSRTILQNVTIDVDGKLTRQPDDGTPLSGETIIFTITDPNGIVRMPKPTAFTNNASGDYAFMGLSGFTQKGTYTVQASFGQTSSLGASYSKTLSVLVGTSAGYAIIVEGKILGDAGLASHNKSTNRVYKTLKDRGFIDNNIYYFNYNTSQDADGDNVFNDVDASPTKAGIQAVIEGTSSWGSDTLIGLMNGSPAPFYIIMLDHGNADTFYIYNNGTNETITPTELDGWLDTLESNLNGNARLEKRIIIYGACYSGSFIDELSLAPTGTDAGRMVISSAALDEESYKGPLESDGIRSGEYFIEEFFKQLGGGYSFKDSFKKASEATETFTRTGGTSSNSANSNNVYFDSSMQHPLIDDDGDGVGSNILSDGTGDGQVAKDIYLGVGITYDANNPGNPAGIVNVTNTLYLNGNTSSAYLWTTAINNVSEAWAEIRPPSMFLTATGGTGQLELNLIREDLTPIAGTSIWEKTVTSFTESGSYEVYYFVKDSTTQEISLTKRSVVYKNKTGNGAPGPFNLISPANGSTQYTTLVLDWSSSSDPDGDPVTYNLLIADASGNIVYKKEEITTTAAIVDADAGLSDLTTYYWKVQAVDAYGLIRDDNYSLAGQPWSFNTDNTNYSTGFITGKVYDNASYAPIAGATITTNGGGAGVSTGDGYYFLQVASGTYTVTSNYGGYFDESISGIIVSSGETAELNIHMSAICASSISPTVDSFTADGGTGNFSVTTNAGCVWAAVSNVSWITITSGNSGSGDGTVNYSITPNTSANFRTGTMTIEGQIFTVTQYAYPPESDGGGGGGGGSSSGGGSSGGGGGGGGGAATCEYSISSGEETFPSEGGTGSVDMSTEDGCKWTAVSNDNWIEITSDSSGSGDGTVEYSVSENTISEERTGTLTIAGETFDVIQDGDTGAIGGGGACEYFISPEEETFTSEGGTGSVDMSTEDGCGWTAASNDNWIEITAGTSGSGDGTVEFSVLQNAGVDLRTGYITITVDGYTETFTVTQAAPGGLTPDIKANNSDGPITIGTDGDLLIEISLSAAGHVGEEADWWLVAKTPSGLESYDLAQDDFVPGLTVTHQSAIFDLGPITIIDTSGLDEGTYVYYFGIDLDMDGELDIDADDEFYIDSVEVTVEEGAVGGGLPKPAGFTASADGATVTLSWDAVDGVEGYMLHYGYSPGEYSGTVDLGNSTGRVFENVPEDAYYVAITAYTYIGESGYSKEVSVTVQ